MSKTVKRKKKQMTQMKRNLEGKRRVKLLETREKKWVKKREGG